jgi:hypothetical protein
VRSDDLGKELIVYDILGMLAFFILIGAQFAGVIVVHRWQTENRSTAGGKRTTDLKAPRKLITALSCRDDRFLCFRKRSHAF